jgi:hypothetical protein
VPSEVLEGIDLSGKRIPVTDGAIISVCGTPDAAKPAKQKD